ncbi:hypothetical protein JW848_04200 [Candidatus Bipolaricaulota bacterium]|nr:hypothetical protein [Candidatus Bipolaricaulota bacterium]
MTIVAAPLIHMIAAAICLMAGRRSRWIVLAAWAAGVGLLAYWIGVFAETGPIHETVGDWGALGIRLALDRPAIAFLLLEQLLVGAVIAHGWRSRLSSAFYALLLVLAGSVCALCMSLDLFNMYVLLELLTLTSFLLVAYERRSVQIWASLKYLLLASLGMSIYLAGVALLYAQVGSLSLPQIGEVLASLSPGEAGWIPIAAALMTAGIAVKAGIFLYSLWLPAAHGSASTGVSALLSGLVIKMGVLALLRLSVILPIDHVLTVLGVMTGIAGALYAIVETDAKRALAFSTLSQVGYLLIGVGAATEAAKIGVLMYIVAHGMFKGLLFLAIGDAGERVGSTEISALRIHRREIPRSSRVAVLVGCAAIVGLPFVGAFWAKEWLFVGSAPVDRALLWLLVFCTALVFSRFLPIVLVRGRCPGERNKSLSYALLGAGLPCTFALAGVLAPGRGWLMGTTLVHAAWTLAVVAAGVLVGTRIPALMTLRLPRSLFRIEEGVVAILAGVFLVYVTICAGT